MTEFLRYATISNGDKNMDTQTHLKLFNYAKKVCRQAGYFADREIEYQSAINWGIFHAVRIAPSQTFSGLISLTCVYALRKCELTRLMFEKWRKQDEAGALRYRLPPTPVVIPIQDMELLKFVACYGRHRSAKLLRIGHNRLRSILDDIALRIAANVA